MLFSDMKNLFQYFIMGYHLNIFSTTSHIGHSLTPLRYEKDKYKLHKKDLNSSLNSSSTKQAVATSYFLNCNLLNQLY